MFVPKGSVVPVLKMGFRGMRTMPKSSSAASKSVFRFFKRHYPDIQIREVGPAARHRIFMSDLGGVISDTSIPFSVFSAQYVGLNYCMDMTSLLKAKVPDFSGSKWQMETVNYTGVTGEEHFYLTCGSGRYSELACPTHRQFLVDFRIRNRSNLLVNLPEVLFHLTCMPDVEPYGIMGKYKGYLSLVPSDDVSPARTLSVSLESPDILFPSDLETGDAVLLEVEDNPIVTVPDGQQLIYDVDRDLTELTPYEMAVQSLPPVFLGTRERMQAQILAFEALAEETGTTSLFPFQRSLTAYQLDPKEITKAAYEKALSIAKLYAGNPGLTSFSDLLSQD